ncbi:MAG TPA: DUF5011 domain-containing protein [Tissierellia bacterium]|nr:DUF5011 domain-containing protein [Tissierellia bacterium]
MHPTYKDGGYLYIIPQIKDDTANQAEIRAGAMALKYDGSESLDLKNNKGFFRLNSNPIAGEFVNRGCSCTGQGEDVDDISHYALRGNHKKDIGFNVIKNHEYLSNIRYFISEKGNTTSYITQGSIAKNSTGEYDIPISSISNKTGEYTVKVVLYSNKGDVTVQEIPVSIESPIIGVSNIMYNQASKNLDFTVTYAKNSIVGNELKDIQIQFGGGDIVEFEDGEKENISLYAISEGGIISKDKWDTDIGSEAFIRTPFSPSDDPNLMTAEFRALLSNMEKAGDKFIQEPGEKRVHLKYTTANKVEVINNNVTVIKKSNLPPSITKVVGKEGIYVTAKEFNEREEACIKIKVEEPIVDLKEVKYDWVTSADTSLIQDGGTIGGKAVTFSDSMVEFELRDIPEVSGEDLFKAHYLIVYAENSAGKFAERTFGPFYVLNKDINNKRFEITVTDQAVSDNHVFVAVDDRLHMIDELEKPDMVKVLWKKDETKIEKEYGLNFKTDESTRNVAYVNVPYIDLIDTKGVGGEFSLQSISIYNSTDKDKVYKEVSPANISQELPQYFVKINMENGGAKVNASIDTVEYAWSKNPFTIPTTWSTTNGAISGINFVPREKGSLIHDRTYLFLKVWNNIYRSDKIGLQANSPLKAVDIESIIIGEAKDGYYGPENGSKRETLIRIKISDDLTKIVSVKYYDLLSSTSGTAINVKNFYKISDNEIAGIMPSVVTSGGAIKCEVLINNRPYTVTSNCVGVLENKISFEQNNRIITLNNGEYSNYSLYQKDGREYKFDEDGKTEIYENGEYLLLYKDNENVFAREINISGINYRVEDIKVTLSPEKPTEPSQDKIEAVNAIITMPPGSTIEDKYGIINKVDVVDNKTIASAVITRSAIYSFDIKFPNDELLKDYEIPVDYIYENLVPEFPEVTSSSAITYDPAGPELTKDNVEAVVTGGYLVLNNSTSGKVVFTNNGKFSLILKNDENNIEIHKAEVNWIDKKCPEPMIKKYVWYDFDSDGEIDEGEKGVEIPEGYKTKNKVIVEISFSNKGRPVKINDSDFINVEPSDNEDYGYKFIYPYNPKDSDDKTPVLRKNLEFTDTLGNTLKYNLVIDEIDRTDLLTQLNYSTTNYTNRDVVVSMSANRPVKRYDIVVVDGQEIEKDASPTYVFKENGTKDFHYRQIEVADDPLQGKLTANVTWIDKSVPVVKAEYDDTLTNNNVEIELTVVNGVDENALLKHGDQFIELKDSGKDKVGIYSVDKNGNYRFTVINKYGNTGEVIVPIYNIDKEEPVLSLKGREHVYIKAGDKYYDQGAVAIDNRDGDITSGIKVENNVNTSIASKEPYKVIYRVTDSAGNTSEKIRYVYVLDIDSAVAIVQDNVIDLRSEEIHEIKLSESGMIFAEFVGIDGSYKVKYSKGEGYDNAYFKTNGSYMSKLGTFTLRRESIRFSCRTKKETHG